MTKEVNSLGTTGTNLDDSHSNNGEDVLDAYHRKYGVELDVSQATTHFGGDKNDSNSEPAIATRETRNLVSIKLLFVCVLLLSAAGALGVFFYIRGKENSDFEAQFSDDGNKVLAALGATLDLSLGSSDAFVASMLSAAKLSGQTWPYVTIPDWAARAGKIRSLTGALYLNLYIYVEEEQRDDWENYTSHNNEWVMDTVEAQENDPSYEGNNTVAEWYENWDVIHGYDEYYKDNAGEFGTNRTGPYLVFWQCHPVLAVDPVYNWDLFTDYGVDLTNCSEWNETAMMEPCPVQTVTDVVVKKHHVVISEAYQIVPEDADQDQIEGVEEEALWLENFLAPGESAMEPISDIYYPILPSGLDTYNQQFLETFDPENQTFAGMLSMTFFWRDTISDILPEGSNGIVVVWENPCTPKFTYQINGPDVEFLGSGDHHDSEFDHLVLSAYLWDLQDYQIKGSSYTGLPIDHDYCPFKIHIYPSDTMKDSYASTNATIFTSVAAVVFLLTSIVFVIYDRYVEKRQTVVMSTAMETRAIVSDLFPSTVRDRIYNSTSFGVNTADSKKAKRTGAAKDSSSDNQNTNPVADTFADCTVAFIDIVGFTSWSSVREPSQVFLLLETLYGAYDKISRRRKVFKVETIGDSYVAVTGLPHPQKNHATIMVRFAAEARQKMNTLVRQLELTLGPGTATLSMRVGLHSGPVTAGVLRGDKARFQLFGDTVNTAARMESTGVPNRIQISRKTAQQLARDGKGHWVSEREELVSAKGKGFLNTFFAEPQNVDQSTGIMDMSMSFDSQPLKLPEKDLQTRLIDWNVAMLAESLKSVVAHRVAKQKKRTSSRRELADMAEFCESQNCAPMVRDEVVDTIGLPTYEDQRISTSISGAVHLSPVVMEQLRTFVSAIAAQYPPNAFHCFEHASHVAMSAKKLLLRVTGGEEAQMDAATEQSHNQSYGIKSDPLTQFAIVFSALVHDVEHPGVANGQLVKEAAVIAKLYQCKSVAEQHSVNIAWNLLMEDRFKDLQECIFPDVVDCKRFRQVMINAVVTTDIFDKELKAARESRWERTYGEAKHSQEERAKDVRDRKATIVIELVIQASDVSHTMQHWHVYQNWNHRLLKEQYVAYKNGRQANNPIDDWYGGELWFYDNYIIPLATKMRDCKVFGVQCDEFLDFATENRLEWANKGEQIVAQWAKTIEEDCLVGDKRRRTSISPFTLTEDRIAEEAPADSKSQTSVSPFTLPMEARNAEEAPDDAKSVTEIYV